MSAKRIWCLLLLALWLVPTGGSAQQRVALIFKDGRRIEVTSYEVRGELTQVKGLRGEDYVVQTDSIDLPASRRATQALNAPTPTPTPTPREKTLLELARETRERRRRTQPEPEQLTPTPVLPPATPTPEAQAQLTPEQSASPEPTLEPTPEPTPTQVAKLDEPLRTPPPLPGERSGEQETQDEGGLPLVPLAAGAVVVVLAAAGAWLLLSRKRAAPAPARAAPAPPATPSDDLLEPAFADEPGETEPPPEEELAPPEAPPAELPGTPSEPASLPQAAEEEQLSLPAPSVLPETGELQIRIGADIYTCPDLPTLKRWIVEGRVLETSEILSPDGQWLLAGTIPDLEEAFVEKGQG